MMTVPAVLDVRMAEFSDFVTAQTGLYFPQPAWRDLQRAAAAAASELGLPDAEASIRWLLTPPVTPRHIDMLARHLTIGETYFFREKPALQALEERILPELIQARRTGARRLRIWSAACCTGEEPYTLAIIVSRLLPDWRDWDITILGTDINSRFLELAARGVYRNWSFRATPDSMKELYFTPQGDEYAIKPDIKQMVSFSQLNLADAGYPSPATNTTNMDIIFCRNTLMYFSQDSVVRVVGNFYKALATGGWLIVNPSEATPALFSQYEVVTQPDAILFRKGHGGRRTDDAPGPWPTMDDGRWTMGASKPVSPAPSSLVPPSQAQHPSSSSPRPLAAIQNSRLNIRDSRDPQPTTNDEAHKLARLAGIEANQGRLTEALVLSERAIQADKTNPAYWYLRATILQERGEPGEAVAALKRVLYLDPGFVLAHFVLGNMALQAMREVEAMRHFNTARAQLKNHKQDDILPGSDDLTAGQLEGLFARDQGSGVRGQGSGSA